MSRRAKYLSELGHMKPETKCHLQVILIDHGFIEKWRQRGVNVASRRRQHDATKGTPRSCFKK